MTPRMKSLLSLHGKKVIMGLILLLVTTLFCYCTAFAATSKTVMLNINGWKLQASTHSQTVRAVLEANKIKVQSHDYVSPSLDAPVKEGMTITWTKGMEVQLKQDRTTNKIWTTVRNVGDFLNQEGIAVGQHDTVSPSSDTPLTQGMIIQVKKGIQINLNVGGKARQIWTFPMTEKDLLNQEKVTLGSKDKVNLDPGTYIHEGSHILVTRVTTKKAVVKESVGYKVINQTDSHLTNGQTRVIRSGKNGERENTYLVTYENGKPTKRDLIETSLVKAPESKIVAQGSMVSSQSNTTSRSVSSSDRTIEMVGTAYTADCQGCTGKTATGINLNSHPDAKIIAVDPSIIPLGSKVYVEGYGYAVAADTGGAIRGHHIDIYMPSQSEAVNWGVRDVTVRVLN